VSRTLVVWSWCTHLWYIGKGQLVCGNISLLFFSLSPYIYYSVVGVCDPNSKCLIFHAGLFPEPPIIIHGSSLSIDDETPEVAEGFLLYLEIDKSRLDSRDVGRISVVNSVILVLMTDNDGECLILTSTHLNSRVNVLMSLYQMMRKQQKTMRNSLMMNLLL